MKDETNERLLYQTPEKFNSDYRRKFSSPETLFTPLKVPGAQREDSS